MYRKLGLYFRTVRYLKFKQIIFYIYYSIKNKSFRNNRLVHTTKPVSGGSLRLPLLIPSRKIFLNGSITLLDLTKSFNDCIDWNYSGYGKLWNYNLNYFEYLLQKDLEVSVGKKLIKNYIDSFPNITYGSRSVSDLYQDA
jgi:hypothetical protein